MHCVQEETCQISEEIAGDAVQLMCYCLYICTFVWRCVFSTGGVIYLFSDNHYLTHTHTPTPLHSYIYTFTLIYKYMSVGVCVCV